MVIKKLLKTLLVFILVASWLLAGWPQIWQKPPIPPKVQKAYAAVTFNLEESAAKTSSLNQTLAIGTPASDRIVVVSLMAENALVNPQRPVSATIGGISATLAAEASHTGDQMVQWWYASVPTGTTAVFTTDADVGACGIDTYSLYGAAATHTDSDTTGVEQTTDSPLTLSALTIPSGGVGFYGFIDDTAAAITWTNATEQSDYVADTSNQCSTAVVTSAGTPSVTAAGTADDAALAAVAFEIGNVAPTLSISQPDGVDDTVTAGTSYNITYTLSDPDSDATVDFYYDTNNSGLDGTAISGCQNQAEGTDATCSWDTTGLGGNLYVYGIADDGVNDPVSDYSDGPITIKASTGTVCSTAITFSDFSGSPTAWNELFWTETEGSGESVTMQIASNSDCSSLISDDAFSGCDFGNQPTENDSNSEGFAVSPVDISCLDEGTYGVIYLKSTLTAGTGSPTLDDWGVSVPENPLLFGVIPLLLGFIRKFRKKIGFRV